jgi:hypothetical protein
VCRARFLVAIKNKLVQLRVEKLLSGSFFYSVSRIFCIALVACLGS